MKEANFVREYYDFWKDFDYWQDRVFHNMKNFLIRTAREFSKELEGNNVKTVYKIFTIPFPFFSPGYQIWLGLSIKINSEQLSAKVANVEIKKLLDNDGSIPASLEDFLYHQFCDIEIQWFFRGNLMFVWCSEKIMRIL